MGEDPFADLGETLQDTPNEEGETRSSQHEGAVSETSNGTDEATIENQAERPEADPTRDVAFSYEQADQRPLYAREETITGFDAWLNYELEGELNARGYRNIKIREMTDALLRTVTEEDLTEAVAERFESSREDTLQE
jgi:hypothetical protein